MGTADMNDTRKWGLLFALGLALWIVTVDGRPIARAQEGAAPAAAPQAAASESSQVVSRPSDSHVGLDRRGHSDAVDLFRGNRHSAVP